MQVPTNTSMIYYITAFLCTYFAIPYLNNNAVTYDRLKLYQGSNAYLLPKQTTVKSDIKGAEDTSVELVPLLHILNFKEAIVL